MKRRQLVFVSVVFSTLITGIILENQRQDDPFDVISITAPGRIELPPVELPPSEESLGGVVLDENGVGLAGVGVHLFRRDRSSAAEPGTRDDGAESIPWARTDAAGRFLVEGAAPGDYGVSLLAPGRAVGDEDISLPIGGPVTWRLGAPLEKPVVMPELVVRGLSGKLSPPVGVSPEEYPMAGYEVWFEPVGGNQAWLAGQVPRRVVVEEDGSFGLQELTLGRYDISVLPPWATGGRWPQLENLSFAHSEASDSEEPNSAARLGLRLRCGSMGGNVYDTGGSAIEGALVQIWPVDQPERIWPTAATDVGGAFLLRGLPPGTYRLRLHAGSGEHEQDVVVRIGAHTKVLPLALSPKEEAQAKSQKETEGQR
ncbi:MAG: hypothetical protein ACI8QS_000383 [Planctomycetota bacterium]|jgi:hypothetical protein